jgi:hypothetical protein
VQGAAEAAGRLAPASPPSPAPTCAPTSAPTGPAGQGGGRVGGPRSPAAQRLLLQGGRRRPVAAPLAAAPESLADTQQHQQGVSEPWKQPGSSPSLTLQATLESSEEEGVAAEPAGPGASQQPEPGSLEGVDGGGSSGVAATAGGASPLVPSFGRPAVSVGATPAVGPRQAGADLEAVHTPGPAPVIDLTQCEGVVPPLSTGLQGGALTPPSWHPVGGSGQLGMPSSSSSSPSISGGDVVLPLPLARLTAVMAARAARAATVPHAAEGPAQGAGG